MKCYQGDKTSYNTGASGSGSEWPSFVLGPLSAQDFAQTATIPIHSQVQQQLLLRNFSCWTATFGSTVYRLLALPAMTLRVLLPPWGHPWRTGPRPPLLWWPSSYLFLPGPAPGESLSNGEVKLLQRGDLQMLTFGVSHRKSPTYAHRAFSHILSASLLNVREKPRITRP